jgi:bacteriorhodopsin
MEINWTFLLSAIYCGIGVVFVAIGMLFGGNAQNRERLEKDINDNFFPTMIIAVVIMGMMTCLWLPYFIWWLFGKNKIETQEGGK